jgi:hypothetical protein
VIPKNSLIHSSGCFQLRKLLKDVRQNKSSPLTFSHLPAFALGEMKNVSA